ncbi:MAG: hypothetical protein ACRDRO_29915 [Pseudonocardiaceae bacterium]
MSASWLTGLPAVKSISWQRSHPNSKRRRNVHCPSKTSRTQRHEPAAPVALHEVNRDRQLLDEQLMQRGGDALVDGTGITRPG